MSSVGVGRPREQDGWRAVDGACLQSEAAPPVHVTSDLPAPVTKQHSLRMAFSTSAGKESGHFDGGPVFAGLQPVVKRKKGNA